MHLPARHDDPHRHGGRSQSPGVGEAAVTQKNNNYSRPSGQNVGNFMTERSSSRVLNPPGGVSSITFG